MKHDAIYSLYSNVVTIDGDDNPVAYDANGTVVSWNTTSVNAKETELLAASKLDDLRRHRDRKLSETDHWALSDTATITQAQIDYRQALRDITDNATSLDDVSWPTKP